MGTAPAAGGPSGGPARLRVCFLGTPEPAVPGLRALLRADDIEVAAVVTNPDRPAGRGKKLRPPPVKVAAADAEVPVWQPERVRDVIGDLHALAIDVAAVVAYGAILPVDALAASRAGFVNLHFSLLPAWRGAAPVTHTLLAGETETGVTCFVLDEGMDTGGVLGHTRTPVLPDETAGELTARLAQLGGPLLLASVRGLARGHLEPVPQDHSQATYAPKIEPRDAALDWTWHAAELARAVRAYNPQPGAHTTFGSDRLKVHRATVVETGLPGHPGLVIGVDEGAPLVGCGRGALRLDVVQPPGKRAMSGESFVHGYQPIGHRLGT